MRVLVCGGRDFCDKQMLEKFLNGMKRKPTVIIHGGARGADTLADQWAESHGIEREVYYADWDNFGKAAGVIRNDNMLKQSNPDLVVAFPGGRGTKDMITRARKAGVLVIMVKTNRSDNNGG